MLRALAKATRTHRMDTDSHILATEQDTPPAARFGHHWKPSQGGLRPRARTWQKDRRSNTWEDKTRGCTKSLPIPIYPKGQERRRSRLITPLPQLRRNQTRQPCLLTTAGLVAAGKYLLKQIQGIWRLLKAVFTSTKMENKD